MPGLLTIPYTALAVTTTIRTRNHSGHLQCERCRSGACSRLVWADVGDLLGNDDLVEHGLDLLNLIGKDGQG